MDCPRLSNVPCVSTYKLSSECSLVCPTTSRISSQLSSYHASDELAASNKCVKFRPRSLYRSVDTLSRCCLIYFALPADERLSEKEQILMNFLRSAGRPIKHRGLLICYDICASRAPGIICFNALPHNSRKNLTDESDPFLFLRFGRAICFFKVWP